MIGMALIGYGYWGPNYARLLGELPGCRLAACSDLNELALARAGERLPRVDLVRDYRTLLERNDVDAVIVATPAGAHYPVVRDFLYAGKHVLCEKPLAPTAAECEELAAIAGACNRTLLVGHTFMFNPAVRMLKEYVDRGELGRTLCFYAQRLGLGPIRKDVSALWDLAPHDVSMLLYLLGDAARPLDVVARGECYVQAGVEDVVFLTLRLQQQILANIHVSWLDPAKVRRLTLVGTEKMAVFDDMDPSHRLRFYDKGFRAPAASESFGEFQAILHDGDVLLPKVPVREPLKEQVLHFLDCIQGEARCVSDGMFAAAVVRVLEMANASLRSRPEAAARELALAAA